MAISLVHAFSSGKADGSDSTLVQPSNWNDEHELTMATARILGRKTASTGAAEELTADDVWDLLGFVGTTRTVFQQTAVPTGWTKDTSHNNKAFRLVSGSVSSGGSSPFTTVFGSAVTSSSYALQTADIPAHTHAAGTLAADSNGAHTHTYSIPNLDDVENGNNGEARVSGTSLATTSSNGAHTHTISGSSASAGGGGGHSHTVTLAVQYVDFVIGEKD